MVIALIDRWMNRLIIDWYYYDRARSYVLGSYASFLWDAEDEEEEEEEAGTRAAVASCDSPALVPAC